MWISRKLTQKAEMPKAERGKITIASAAPEAGASVNSRSITAYAPYGYACTPPVGTEVLLLPCAEGQAAVGVKASGTAAPGEIEIASLGGARIRLGNDGCIYLNGILFMNSEGRVCAGI